MTVCFAPRWNDRFGQGPVAPRNDRFACKPPPMRQKYKSTIPPAYFHFPFLAPVFAGISRLLYFIIRKDFFCCVHFIFVPFMICAYHRSIVHKAAFSAAAQKSTAAGCLPCFVVLSFMRAPCRGLCRPLRRRCRILEKRPRIGSAFRCRFPCFNQILKFPGLFLNGVLRYTMGAARAKPWIARQRQNRTEGLCKRFWSVTTSATL